MTPPRELTLDTDRQSASANELGAMLLQQTIASSPAGETGNRSRVEAVVAAGGQEKSDVPVSPASTAPDQGVVIHRGVHDPTGQKQAAQDARLLRHLPNQRFVERIEHDCAVGPHLEWSIAAGTIAAKSLVKGWILGKAGESMGVGARTGGYAAGVALGTVTGFYTAYETADLLENSCRAHAYEERLNQTRGGTVTEPPSVLDPITQTYDVERGFPSVRTVVDYSSDHVKSLFGKPPDDSQSVNSSRVLAHKNLDDASYITWAHKASTVPISTQVERGLGFASVGFAGGFYAGSKLHLGWQGSLVAASGGALLGVGLSCLGVAAKEDTKLAELLKLRLMSRPHDVPRP
jgi:hypothetical protein